VRRRSEESPRTDGGALAPNSALSKRVAKQSCEVGTVRPHTADSEPREGALTAKAVKSRRKTAGETRHIPQMVFVVDAEGRPLAPCHPARARQLLDKGAATVEETHPFAIRLVKSVPDGLPVEADFKVDTGSKHHGIALVEVSSGKCLLWGQIDLRTDIKERMEWRSICRRARRNRNTRYRKPRFDNRKRSEGWLPPSLKHRVDVLVKVAKRLSRYVKIRRNVAETASFDIQRMMNPEIEGVGYQKGPLFRTDLRKYLLLKHNGKCAYCKKALGDGWQADHVQPKSRGGSDRAFNRVAACEPCNVRKSNQTASEFGHPEVVSLAKEAYAPAAIVTSIKTAVVRELSKIALVVETDGTLTSRNRKAAKLEKSHAADALCALEAPKDIQIPPRQILFVARSAGTRQLVNGVRGEHKTRLGREIKGFRQWDEVIWNGSRCYVKGRRKTGKFLLSNVYGQNVKDGVSFKKLRLIHRCKTLQGTYVKVCI
jgi:5-methylcytosine-specific restriction endonuclease McrA